MTLSLIGNMTLKTGRKELTTVEEVEKILFAGEFEIVSYGLAPNPFGFCFEYVGATKENEKLSNRLSFLLDALTDEEEQYIKDNYL